MLSLDFIRKNQEKVAAAAKNKNREIDLPAILKLDDERRDLIGKIQTVREQRNQTAKQGASDETIKKGRELKESLKKLEDSLAEVEQKLEKQVSRVPNVPLDEVPVGDATQNKEVKKWGEPKKGSLKSHLELAESLDLIDFERGSKVSGFRGYFLKNQAAILHMAVLMYAYQKLALKGYTPLVAPAIVKEFTLFGSGQLPWGEKELYKLNDDDAYLSGTAEVPVTSYYSGDFIPEEELPKKFVALSPCFRREAGAYGKDTKGLYRVHEFWKVEQVILAKNDLEEGLTLHEELQKNTEEFFEELELPYRTILMATGEMGEPQMKKYDTEVWMPSRDEYGEAASNSIMGDFQARRLKLKFRRKDHSTDYCFTLNNTAIASPRILIALLENHQQEDGSIKIPKVLHSFTGFDSIKK